MRPGASPASPTANGLDGLDGAVGSEEERMAKFIGDLLPQLATDVAHDEIPVSEIEGDAAAHLDGLGPDAEGSTQAGGIA
jgi:hypothetical protein